MLTADVQELKEKRERDRSYHKDKEIDELLRIHGEDNVHIIEDTDP
jgi:adenylate kinase